MLHAYKYKNIKKIYMHMNTGQQPYQDNTLQERDVFHLPQASRTLHPKIILRGNAFLLFVLGVRCQNVVRVWLEPTTSAGLHEMGVRSWSTEKHTHTHNREGGTTQLGPTSMVLPVTKPSTPISVAVRLTSTME